ETHGRESKPKRAGQPGQGTCAGGAARAGRSRGAAKGRRGERQADAEGVSGPEGTGADALWRLGKQGHRLGLLGAHDLRATASRLSQGKPVPTRIKCGAGFLRILRWTKKPRSRAACPISIWRRDQRVTTTLVPTETRL